MSGLMILTIILALLSIGVLFWKPLSRERERQIGKLQWAVEQDEKKLFAYRYLDHVIRVIDSCQTREQFRSVERWVFFYIQNRVTFDSVCLLEEILYQKELKIYRSLS